MLTIGIVGGVASGKSVVAATLAEQGAVVLKADEAGHEVLHDPEVQAALRERWGEQVFQPDGQIDRKAVGRIVFADGAAAERKFLNRLTHPRIRKRLLAQREAARAAGVPAVVVDAALLFESGWGELCDASIFVDTPRASRQANAARRGWPPEELASREASQMSLQEKRRRATLTIENTGSVEELSSQAIQAWRRLVQKRS